MVLDRSDSCWFKEIMLFIFFKMPLLISFGKWSVLHSPPKFTSDIKGSGSPRRIPFDANAGYPPPIDPGLH